MCFGKVYIPLLNENTVAPSYFEFVMSQSHYLADNLVAGSVLHISSQ